MQLDRPAMNKKVNAQTSSGPSVLAQPVQFIVSLLIYSSWRHTKRARCVGIEGLEQLRLKALESWKSAFSNFQLLSVCESNSNPLCCGTSILGS